MPTIDLPTALLWTQRILGLGLLIQSVELVQARRIFGRDGALVGRVNILWLLIPRIFGALGLMVVSTESIAWQRGLTTLLLLNSLWLTLRSRGPVCGGSDSMFFQVQLGLLLASWGGELGAKLGMGWIAAQSVLSYVIAGLGKARNASWWNGTAMRHLFTSSGPYVLLKAVRNMGAQRSLCVLLGWVVVGFELVFPAVLLMPVAGKWMLLAFVLGFHLANAAVLGLNRFVWAWLATYPALLYFK